MTGSMHEEITILDIVDNGNTFKVIFEVPGTKYGLNYPKRLAHNFIKEKRMFLEDEEKNPLWLKKLHLMHLKDPEENPVSASTDKELVDCCKKFKGKKYFSRDKIVKKKKFKEVKK